MKDFTAETRMGDISSSTIINLNRNGEELDGTQI